MRGSNFIIADWNGYVFNHEPNITVVGAISNYVLALTALYCREPDAPTVQPTEHFGYDRASTRPIGFVYSSRDCYSVNAGGQSSVQLKILWRATSVRVRVPPPAPKLA